MSKVCYVNFLKKMKFVFIFENTQIGIKFIKEELNLSETSRFILVNEDNENDQIEDADELCEHWNEFANRHMKNCVVSMVCVVFVFDYFCCSIFYLFKKMKIDLFGNQRKKKSIDMVSKRSK
ncbi:hypothetical protein RFI_32844 [Reticulomyxa filosa]|uniref:Uncharacterized protein n=1 Tax=Reticulomyxa filosa TaxID=46433 RepID=X6LT45_RETFI|nr:hypothetical protein RFI_32844 [Reticulomyxa filosa]|eukprot:ETO04551.1 hypothetical protein RFI_32844 [Reticulomyxa filosa]